MKNGKRNPPHFTMERGLVIWLNINSVVIPSKAIKQTKCRYRDKVELQFSGSHNVYGRVYRISLTAKT